MKPFRVRAVRTAIVAGLALIAAIVAERPLRASQAEPLLQPTPLVLKDGRIASVSIHVVPFAPGRAELGGQAAARMAELTRAAATDCFLTAQVIGHIDSNEFARDDTLNAHRLARSRADAVQASLIGGGLPAKSIAAVWDWQFMVRAPRATLWIFQLTAGEDCEGRPLDGALVAQTPPSSSQTAAAPERAAPPAPAERTAAAAAHAPVAHADAAARPAEPAAVRRKVEPPQARAGAPSSTPAQLAVQPKRTAPEEPAEQRERGSAVAARPALAPKAPTGDGAVERPAARPATGTSTAAKPAPATTGTASERKVEQPAKQRETGNAIAAKPASAATAPASDGKVEGGAEGSLVITFATNSSYFPSGTTRRLRQLIAGIDPENKYEVSVKIAVSGSTKVVGARSPQEAARYNKWLAERRLERVQNWLLENGGAVALTFKPEYVTDESRQVVVRVTPAG